LPASAGRGPQSPEGDHPLHIEAPRRGNPPELVGETKAEQAPSQPAPVVSAAPLTPKPVRRSVSPSAPQSPATPSSAQAEIALYLHALSQLNVAHDPAAALGTLSAYGYKYPNGILRGESTVAMIKAELMLGLDAEVLGLLDAMTEQDFAGSPQPSEL